MWYSQRWTRPAHCSRSLTSSQIGNIIYAFYPDNIAFKSENTNHNRVQMEAIHCWLNNCLGFLPAQNQILSFAF